MRRFIDIFFYGVLLALVRARREVGVSSRNVVSRTFPQFFNSRLTPMLTSCCSFDDVISPVSRFEFTDGLSLK